MHGMTSTIPALKVYAIPVQRVQQDNQVHQAPHFVATAHPAHMGLYNPTEFSFWDLAIRVPSVFLND